MTARPILFSGPMVRALIEGRKTQTRRPLMLDGDVRGDPYIGEAGNGACALWDDLDGTAYRFPGALGAAVGDRLWVREAWQSNGLNWRKKIRDMALGLGPLHYAATDSGGWKPYWGGWKPGIHMPRWASRLTLVVTEVRVERLQDISEADAIAEGIEQDPETRAYWGADGQGLGGATRLYEHAAHAYRDLWDHLNSSRGYGWDANPWVVALTFTVHHQNIDALGAKEAA